MIRRIGILLFVGATLANPALTHLTHRRTYNPNRAEAQASPGSCS